MGRVTRLRKIRRLETRASGVAASVAQLEEIRRDRALSAALALLGDADLRAVGALVDAALSEAGKPGLGDGGTVDLWRFARDARDRKALHGLQNALAAAQSEASEEQAKLTRGA